MQARTKNGHRELSEAPKEVIPWDAAASRCRTGECRGRPCSTKDHGGHCDFWLLVGEVLAATLSLQYERPRRALRPETFWRSGPWLQRTSLQYERPRRALRLVERRAVDAGEVPAVRKTTEGIATSDQTQDGELGRRLQYERPRRALRLLGRVHLDDVGSLPAVRKTTEGIATLMTISSWTQLREPAVRKTTEGIATTIRPSCRLRPAARPSCSTKDHGGHCDDWSFSIIQHASRRIPAVRKTTEGIATFLTASSNTTISDPCSTKDHGGHCDSPARLMVTMKATYIATCSTKDHGGHCDSSITNAMETRMSPVTCSTKRPRRALRLCCSYPRAYGCGAFSLLPQGVERLREACDRPHCELPVHACLAAVQGRPPSR
jgi:hypothetical protein